MKHKFSFNYVYRNWVLPKLFFFIYFIFKFVLLLIVFINKLISNKKRKNTSLLISAGENGWKSIEFKELLQTAKEYLPISNEVCKHIIIDHNNYFDEIYSIIKKNNFSHILCDPRNGKQSLIGGTIETLKVSILFTIYNITPIVLSTDISYRRWRIKTAIYTTLSGIVVCFVSPKLIKPIFPHNRIFGPFLMPFSIKLFNSLSGLKNDLSIYNEKKAKFIGSLYEPRTKKLMYIKKELNKLNLDLEIMGRVVGKERRSDSIYWETLVNSSIILTTSDQIESDEIDWNWVPNLVYRYLEAIASGSLLIAPDVPSISRFFKPFIHFIPFTSEKDAVDKIVYYLANDNERENIANAGKKKAEFLIKSHLFWASIDTALSSENLV